jgi:hypothetical protein
MTDQRELRDRILAYYDVPQDLLSAFEQAIANGLNDEHDAEIAMIGRLLCDRGLDDVWHVVFELHERIYEHTAADPLMFLLEHSPASPAEDDP